MNTEASLENDSMTTGQRLRQAREALGMSQQHIAERLCLKLSTVRDIEDDKAQADLASTFLRGYIRSYAKLVNLSEEDIAPLLAQNAPLKAVKVAPMQSFSLGKTRKKRDNWLMGFTWLVLIIVVGLTGAWWWQNHQAQQEEITSMATQSTAKLAQGDANGKHIELTPSVPASSNAPMVAAPEANASSTTQTTSSQAVAPVTPAVTPAAPATATPSATIAGAAPAEATASAAAVSPSAPENTLPTASTASAVLPTNPASAAVATPDVANGLVMSFSAACWVDIKDAAGKTVLSGVQKAGSKINVTGTAPYKAIIGAPGAVQIEYQGKPVDLSKFVKSNRVARLTIAAE